MSYHCIIRFQRFLGKGNFLRFIDVIFRADDFSLFLLERSTIFGIRLINFTNMSILNMILVYVILEYCHTVTHYNRISCILLELPVTPSHCLLLG